jgi:hypothetical protein
MTTVTVNRELAKRLCETADVVQLHDDRGNVIGSFVPYLPTPYDPAMLPPPTPEEDIQREIEAGSLLTTEEVFRRLRALE